MKRCIRDVGVEGSALAIDLSSGGQPRMMMLIATKGHGRVKEGIVHETGDERVRLACMLSMVVAMMRLVSMLPLVSMRVHVSQGR